MEAVGRFVVVTGGTGGVGIEVVKSLVEQGIIPVVGIHKSGWSERTFSSFSDAAIMFPLDLADGNSVDDFLMRLKCVVGDKGKLVGCMCCASPAPTIGVFTRVRRGELEYHLKVNVIGYHHLLSSLINSFFKSQKKGCIGAILSEAIGDGKAGNIAKNLGAYSIGKAGFKAILDLLQIENPWLSIRTISPGYIDTKMLDNFGDRIVDHLKQQRMVTSPQVVADTFMDICLNEL